MRRHLRDHNSFHPLQARLLIQWFFSLYWISTYKKETANTFSHDSTLRFKNQVQLAIVWTCSGLQSTAEVYLKDLSQAQDLQSPERSNESLIFVRDQTYLSLSSGCLEVYKELISISLMDSDFLLPSIKVPGWKASDCASSHGMNLGSCGMLFSNWKTWWWLREICFSRTDVSKPWTHLKGEEFCMLTERAIEEPNLRRSAEMKNMFYDPLCFVFQPSSKLELIHIWD